MLDLPIVCTLQPGELNARATQLLPGVVASHGLWMDKRHAIEHLLRAAILMDEVKDGFYFTRFPMRALMAVFVALAPVGRWFGYRSVEWRRDRRTRIAVPLRPGPPDLP